MNHQITSQKDKNLSWNVKTFEINIDSMASKMNISIDELKKLLAKAQIGVNERYPTTVCYEFFDENDDLLPDQLSYRRLLSFDIDSSMRRKIHNCSEEQLKSYAKSAVENGPKIGEKMSENSKGEFHLIDFFIDYEKRNSYFIVYFQYKIRRNEII